MGQLLRGRNPVTREQPPSSSEASITDGVALLPVAVLEPIAALPEFMLLPGAVLPVAVLLPIAGTSGAVTSEVGAIATGAGRPR